MVVAVMVVEAGVVGAEAAAAAAAAARRRRRGGVSHLVLLVRLPHVGELEHFARAAAEVRAAVQRHRLVAGGRLEQPVSDTREVGHPLRVACRGTAESPHLWGGPRRAPEATAGLQAAQAALRGCVGAGQVVQGGRLWGGVVGQGRRHVRPAGLPGMRVSQPQKARSAVSNSSSRVAPLPPA